MWDGLLKISLQNISNLSSKLKDILRSNKMNSKFDCSNNIDDNNKKKGKNVKSEMIFSEFCDIE